jgi:sialic acid synthase SpsE
LPTVLSTGMAVVGEIDDAVQKFQENNSWPLHRRFQQMLRWPQ